jgi:hypothetical protein
MVNSHQTSWEPILTFYLNRVKNDSRGAHVFIEYGSFNPDVVSSDTIEFVGNKFDIISRIPRHEDFFFSRGTILQIISGIERLESYGRILFRITFFSGDETLVNTVYERGTITRPLPIARTRNFVMPRRRVAQRPRTVPRAPYYEPDSITRVAEEPRTPRASNFGRSSVSADIKYLCSV